MARITEARRRVFANTVDPGAIGRAQAGFEAFGQLADVAGAFLQKRQEQADAARAAEVRTRFELDAHEIFNRVKRDPKVQKDPNLFQETFDTEFDKLSQNLIDQEPGPIKTSLNQKRQELEVTFGKQIITDKANMLSANASASGQAAKDNVVLLAARTNQSISDLMAKGAAGINARFQAGFIDEAGRITEIDDLNSDIVTARARRFIDNGNLVGAIDFIKSEEFGEFVNPEDQEALRKQVTNASEKFDREARRLAEERQDMNTFAITNQIIGGTPPSISDVEAAVTSGQVGPKQGIALQKLVLNPPPTANNIYALTDLNTKLINGTLNINDVLDAAANNQISREEQNKFIRSLTADIATNPAVKRARELIESQYERGFLGIRTLNDEQSLANDLDQLFERSLLGQENPLEVAETIIKGNKDRSQQFTQEARERRLRKRLDGDISTKSIKELKREILDELNTGQVSEDTANEDLKILRRMEEDLSGQR